LAGVRDYIHIMDLASGHVAALEKLKQEHLRMKVSNFFVYVPPSFFFLLFGWSFATVTALIYLNPLP